MTRKDVMSKPVKRINESINKIHVMLARMKICQRDLAEDYFQMESGELILCSHQEADLKNQIIGTYIARIQEEVGIIQKVLQQLNDKTPRERQLPRGKK